MQYTKYLGIPFKDNGRSMDGFDCWGLVKELYHEYHRVILPDFLYDEATEDTVALFFVNELSVKQVWEKVVPQEGSIAVFQIAGLIRHTGFMVNDTQFIHTISGTETVIESIQGLRWSGRFKGCYKWQV